MSGKNTKKTSDNTYRSDVDAVSGAMFGDRIVIDSDHEHDSDSDLDSDAEIAMQDGKEAVHMTRHQTIALIGFSLGVVSLVMSYRVHMIQKIMELIELKSDASLIKADVLLSQLCLFEDSFKESHTHTLGQIVQNDCFGATDVFFAYLGAMISRVRLVVANKAVNWCNKNNNSKWAVVYDDFQLSRVSKSFHFVLHNEFSVIDPRFVAMIPGSITQIIQPIIPLVDHKISAKNSASYYNGYFEKKQSPDSSNDPFFAAWQENISYGTLSECKKNAWVGSWPDVLERLAINIYESKTTQVSNNLESKLNSLKDKLQTTDIPAKGDAKRPSIFGKLKSTFLKTLTNVESSDLLNKNANSVLRTTHELIDFAWRASFDVPDTASLLNVDANHGTAHMFSAKQNVFCKENLIDFTHIFDNTLQSQVNVSAYDSDPDTENNFDHESGLGFDASADSTEVCKELRSPVAREENPVTNSGFEFDASANSTEVCKGPRSPFFMVKSPVTSAIEENHVSDSEPLFDDKSKTVDEPVLYSVTLNDIKEQANGKDTTATSVGDKWDLNDAISQNTNSNSSENSKDHVDIADFDSNDTDSSDGNNHVNKTYVDLNDPNNVQTHIDNSSLNQAPSLDGMSTHESDASYTTMNNYSGFDDAHSQTSNENNQDSTIFISSGDESDVVKDLPSKTGTGPSNNPYSLVTDSDSDFDEVNPRPTTKQTKRKNPDKAAVDSNNILPLQTKRRRPVSGAFTQALGEPDSDDDVLDTMLEANNYDGIGDPNYDPRHPSNLRWREHPRQKAAILAGIQRFINESRGPRDYELMVGGETQTYFMQPMDNDELMALEKRVHSIHQTDWEEISYLCAICHSDMDHVPENEDSQIIVVLPCGHHFHEDCIFQWLGIKGFCPVCKASARAQ